MLSAQAPDQKSTLPAMFEAVVTPHRSLSPRGLRLLVGALVLLSATITTVFWSLGAWPVAGFNGAEITLAILLLRVNARAGREREIIRLDEQRLRVLRTDIHGRQAERVLDPSWLTVVLDERPGRVPALLLRARQDAEEVANRLGETEKRDLAQALREALHRWRHPRFDNPQLTEG